MNQLVEATLSQVARKQKSITRLFPDFFTNPIKVKGVIDKGGLRMTGIEGDTWKFQIHSGSEDGKWYDANVRWKNMVPNLQRLAADRRNWNRAKSKVDLKKLAAKLFSSSDIELSCSCPAQLYWGGDYILSKDRYRAKYGDPENRPPEVRNPKEYGAHCKHLQALMRALPFYKSTMANWLKREYGEVIQTAESEAARQAQAFGAVGQELGRRRTSESSVEDDRGDMQHEDIAISMAIDDYLGEECPFTVVPGRTRGYGLNKGNKIYIDTRVLQTETLSFIASVIKHEMEHIQLTRKGIPSSEQENAVRRKVRVWAANQIARHQGDEDAIEGYQKALQLSTYERKTEGFVLEQNSSSVSKLLADDVRSILSNPTASKYKKYMRRRPQ